jgi:hypothetical protein
LLRRYQNFLTPDDAFTHLDCSFRVTGELKASKPEHFRAAIHQATVEVITLQKASKDLNLITFAQDWYPEIQALIARTTVEVRPGKARPKLAYPTENTRGIILGWLLKRQREQLQMQAKSIAADAEGVDNTSKLSEADVDEVIEASDVLDANETMGATADTAEDHVYNAAEVEQAIFAEDEKLAERQRREFEVQHGRDHDSQRTVLPNFFYEGVESPALGADQSYLDMKLNFKDEMTYFVGIPASKTAFILTLDPAVSPYHKIDRTSHTGSRAGQG